MLWHDASGTVVTWEMQSGAWIRTHRIGSMGDTWQVQGTSDTNNDGDSDILWRDASGRVITWEMENGGVLRTQDSASSQTHGRSEEPASLI